MQNRNQSRRLFAVPFIALILLCVFSTSVYAHPLGNFTINQYVRIEPASTQVRIVYVVDMAEIPAHTERRRIDANGDGVLAPAETDAYARQAAERLAAGLALTVNGRQPPLIVRKTALSFPSGQAQLPTLRLVVHYESELPEGDMLSIALHNANYADRLGWREIVVRPHPGVYLVDANTPLTELSQELTAYPQEILPLDMREIEFSMSLTSGSTPVENGVKRAAIMSTGEPVKRSIDPFTDLVATPDVKPWAVALAMLAAIGWGAMHALSPGHGKTIVAAYLVGSRGTARHAVFLGLTTTITHTAGVFTLGFVTLALSHFILPEQLYPWLSAASGVLVVVIGASLVRGRHYYHAHDPDHLHEHGHSHTHAHGHSHTHNGHTHSHLPPSAVTWRGLLALGVSGGLLPCPSALVLMLGAISLNRIGFGLLLIVMFSIGLAGVLTAIGIAMVHAGKWVARLPESGRILTLAPIASAIFITGAGLIITAQAIARTGLFAQ
jgi:ABC-type nickel/cobalt efflux system permease component RcnA